MFAAHYKIDFGVCYTSIYDGWCDKAAVANVALSPLNNRLIRVVTMNYKMCSRIVKKLQENIHLAYVTCIKLPSIGYKCYKTVLIIKYDLSV